MKDIIIVLDRLRSAHNVGNIFRLAEALNAAVIGCGATPMPPHPKLERTAMGTEKTVPFRTFPEVMTAITELRQAGYQILAAEPGGGVGSEAWNREYTLPVAVIFGNEALGVAEDALAKCDGIVSLPMLGEKSSINVGNAAAAILYAVEARSRLL